MTKENRGRLSSALMLLGGIGLAALVIFSGAIRWVILIFAAAFTLLLLRVAPQFIDMALHKEGGGTAARALLWILFLGMLVIGWGDLLSRFF